MYGYIYLIRNRINGKIYVGQHKYDKIELDPNYHGSGVKLQNAYNKYGIDKFDITLIDTADTVEELNQKEAFYIDVLDCRNPDVGYNIGEGGGIYNLFEGHKHTEEWKQKMSEACSGEKNGFYNKQHAKESRKLIAVNHADFSGSKNPRAKKCIYNGIEFGCIKDAWRYARENNLTTVGWITFYNQFKC